MLPTTHEMEKLLQAALQPTVLKINDFSAAHAGHSQAKGGGHFEVLLVSSLFQGKNPVQRHRLVYEALGDLMKEAVHALSLQLFTPQEFEEKN